MDVFLSFPRERTVVISVVAVLVSSDECEVCDGCVLSEVVDAAVGVVDRTVVVVATGVAGCRLVPRHPIATLGVEASCLAIRSVDCKAVEVGIEKTSRWNLNP
jgi:hypothetical protein